ncbi:ankyrin repeat-containing protein ITN1 [Quercus suber]|uniref:ankyrin repeat-containing protein ITN1 n=1 Tax=Quercus suber TaxID=58331 RepID=UPI0032DE7F82
MDPRLLEAIARNDKNTFINLVQENENFLEQRTDGSRSTVLHLATRFGHVKLVMEILKLRPMVAAENNKLETPLHEACIRGHTEVLKLLLEHNPWAACKLNADNQSAFFMACSHGHVDLVKLLLNQSWLVGLEDEGFDPTCLHVAASRGHTGVVRELLNVFPDLAWKVDKNGYSPLHHACNSGNLEITRILLKLSTDLALQFSSTGHMPLHLAAMNAKPEIFEEFEQIAPISFHHLTRQGETVFHLTVKYKHYEAFIWLVGAFHNTDLFHHPDQCGNTLLHLAVSGGCSQDNSTMPDHSPKKTTSSLANLQRHKLLSRRRKVELTKLYNDRRSRQHDIYREALQNARNTITLVAILIATVTFTAGLNPPGGVYQQQSSSGNSTVAGITAFKVFTISNNFALFTSLSIVIILVSIIPFQRKLLMRLLVVTHKVMWLAVSFVATSYVAATWIILPHGHGKEWILAISAATMGALFFYLGVVLARHWLRKLKWRKDKGKKQGTVALTDSKTQSQSAKPDIKLDIKSHSTNSNTRDETRSESKSNFSTNSDLSSSRCLGYHAY